MITLTIEEYNMLKNPGVAPSVKNNFAAKKLDSAALLVSNQMATNAYEILLTQYEDQEEAEYTNSLVFAKNQNKYK